LPISSDRELSIVDFASLTLARDAKIARFGAVRFRSVTPTPAPGRLGSAQLGW